MLGGLRTLAPHAGELVRPLRPQEYLNSMVADKDVSLHSRRLSWESRLHFDNPTYIITHYNQVSSTWPHVAVPLAFAAPHHESQLGWGTTKPRSSQGERMVAGTGRGFRAQLPPH